ncbi:hypothetical protein ACV33P_15830 [Pseudomonas aeruginosa]
MIKELFSIKFIGGKVISDLFPASIVGNRVMIEGPVDGVSSIVAIDGNGATYHHLKQSIEQFGGGFYVYLFIDISIIISPDGSTDFSARGALGEMMRSNLRSSVNGDLVSIDTKYGFESFTFTPFESQRALVHDISDSSLKLMFSDDSAKAIVNLYSCCIDPATVPDEIEIRIATF